jgi:peroxiredoxin (alkyl hydroperoxide reductase subunit C)
MAESIGCARPTGRVLGQTDEKLTPDEPTKIEEANMSVRPGQKAPDFAAPAYHKRAFTEVKLSDSVGHWALLCFYPGDFTFV